MELKLDQNVLCDKYIMLKKLSPDNDSTSYETIFIVNDFQVFESAVNEILEVLVGKDYEVERKEESYVITIPNSLDFYVLINFDEGVVDCF